MASLDWAAAKAPHQGWWVSKSSVGVVSGIREGGGSSRGLRMGTRV